jgi:hypothetical protein
LFLSPTGSSEPGGREETIRFLRDQRIEGFCGNLLLLDLLMKVSDSSELRRSACASLLVVEVLSNLSNREEEKNSSEFFEVNSKGFIQI